MTLFINILPNSNVIIFQYGEKYSQCSHGVYQCLAIEITYSGKHNIAIYEASKFGRRVFCLASTAGVCLLETTTNMFSYFAPYSVFISSYFVLSPCSALFTLFSSVGTCCNCDEGLVGDCANAFVEAEVINTATSPIANTTAFCL